MIGLKWKPDSVYLLKEKQISVQYDLIDFNEKVWASYYLANNVYIVKNENISFSKGKDAKEYCENLAKTRIKNEIERLQRIIDGH